MDDQKCIPGRRKSFVGHPTAIFVDDLLKQHIVPANSTIRELKKKAPECEERARQETEPKATDCASKPRRTGMDCSVAIRRLDSVINQKGCSRQLTKRIMASKVRL